MLILSFFWLVAQTVRRLSRFSRKPASFLRITIRLTLGFASLSGAELFQLLLAILLESVEERDPFDKGPRNTCG
jgi:hypothetical protein